MKNLKILKKLKIDYKYGEDETLVELSKYIDSTYDEHYSKNNFQATEFIIDGGHGEGDSLRPHARHCRYLPLHRGPGRCGSSRRPRGRR